MMILLAQVDSIRLCGENGAAARRQASKEPDSEQTLGSCLLLHIYQPGSFEQFDIGDDYPLCRSAACNPSAKAKYSRPNPACGNGRGL